jgi:histidine triad (HIT) family protein
MTDCLFCKIIANQIPSSKVYEDDYTYAFNDINPQAPVHILLAPKMHYAGIHEVTSDNMNIIKKLFDSVSAIVMQKGLAESGYRLVVNFGETAGQSVPHIHIHILSGREMRWPPG